jgi:hypothetical protein
LRGDLFPFFSMPEDADHHQSAASEEADPASSYPDLEEMSALLPQYEIHRVIGIGGMGAIYLGRQSALDRWVAIKLLPISAAQNAEDAQRFIKEARAMAKLVHPHIVAVFDFGQTHEGHLYLVMEYVEGSDLHRRTRAGEITPKRVRQVVFQLCDALQFAHDRGVIHRDIKPANILITDQWQVKVADFGLAREMAAIPNADEPEYGTPDYTAPERLIVGAVVDHRADIYALGVVMHEMLTGKTPSSAGKDAGKDLPPEFAAVISKCLMHEPERRYQKASEVKMALADAMAEKKKGPEAAGHAASLAHELLPSTYQPSLFHKLSRTLGPLGWGLASVILVAGVGWMVVRNHLRNQANESAGSARNTAAGVGKLAVFAPPKPTPPPAPKEAAKPEVTVAPEPPVGPPAPAPKAAAVVAKEMEEPVIMPPAVPLDQPYKIEDGAPGEVARLKGHKASVFSIKLFGDQRRVVSASYDATVRVWDLMGQNELLRINPGIEAMTRVSLSPDGKRMLAGSFTTSRVAVIDVDTSKVIGTTTLPNGRFSTAIFGPDGHTALIGTSSEAPTLYRWDADKGSELEAIPQVVSWVGDMSVLPGDPPNRVLIAGSVPKENDAKFRIGSTVTLNTGTGEVTQHTASWKGNGRINLSADGRHFSVLGMSVFVLEQPSMTMVAAVDIPPGKARPKTAMLLTDGRFMASIWADDTFRIHEVETSEEVYSAQIDKHVSDLVVSRDGRWAVISTSRLNKEAAAPGDFDLIVWRLPKLESSENGLKKLAAKQLTDLATHDPELAKLRENLPQVVKVPSPADTAGQLQTLNTQYVSALRRKAATQPPTEQQALLAEVELIGLGVSLPPEGMDITVAPALRDLRVIYRKQLASLETQQKQALETAAKAIEVYFAPLRETREKAGDRLGAARVRALARSFAPGATGSSADATPKTTGLAPQAVGTPVKRPDRLCNVISIARAAKNGYIPSTVPVGSVPVDLGPVVAISGGEGHAYALLPDGRVRAWGSKAGEPVSAPAEAKDIVKLDASNDSALALRADGKVVVWATESTDPAQIWEPPAGKAPSDICAGSDGTGYVVFTDGSIQHTANDGVGRNAESTAPGTLGPVSRLIHVPKAGFCALLRDGSCVYWGLNISPVTPPPANLRDLISLSFSEKYAVALQRDGILAGWGELAPGQRFSTTRFNASIGLLHDPAGRILPLHRSDHSWELVANPSTPEYLGEDRVSALEGRLRGCVDALFTQYYVLALRPQ